MHHKVYVIKNEFGGIYGYFDKKISNELIIRFEDYISTFKEKGFSVLR